jgi:hypothetical protein
MINEIKEVFQIVPYGSFRPGKIRPIKPGSQKVQLSGNIIAVPRQRAITRISGVYPIRQQTPIFGVQDK